MNTFRKYCLVISLVLTACLPTQDKLTPTPLIIDDSLITASSCESPCWRGLVPGKSNRQDAIDFLKTDPLVAGNYDPDHVSTAGMWWWWADEEQSGDRTNRFIFESDLLLEIWLVPNTDITLKSVLDVNGAPDMFTLLVRHNAHSGVQGYDLEVWYIKLGVRIKWEYTDKELPYENPTITVCPDLNSSASQILYLTEERIRQGVEQSTFHTTRNGMTFFPGNELATTDGVSGSTKCFTINTR